MAPATAQPDSDSGPAVLCTACAHSWQGHDAVARRYCDATRARALDRHCLCAA